MQQRATATTQPAVRFAIMGAGMISGAHAAAIGSHDRAELVVVCSRDHARAAVVAESYGKGCVPTTDWEGGVLGRADVDAVVICTASGDHAAFGIQAAEAGKHVLVEKPIDIALEKADALIAAAERHGVLLGVVFQLRFLDACAEAKAAIERGDLGTPVQFDCIMKFYRPPEYYASSGWKGTAALDGGGALINQGSHGLDLLLYLVGERVVSVSARTASRRHAELEVEDTCVAVLTFASGALGVVSAGRFSVRSTF
jgi:UDP-N-acetyl-2-amino-2-deoxyglucuronate dehydrogenase